MKCTEPHETHVSQFPTSPQCIGGWIPMYKIMQCQVQKASEPSPTNHSLLGGCQTSFLCRSFPAKMFPLKIDPHPLPYHEGGGLVNIPQIWIFMQFLGKIKF